MFTIVDFIRNHLDDEKARSAWDRGVVEYANDLLDDLQERLTSGEIITEENIQELLLNGAASWSQFSWGGCALIYDGDIAERLCTPSELKRTHGGELPPNKSEAWLDVQARALRQASDRIERALHRLCRIF